MAYGEAGPSAAGHAEEPGEAAQEEVSGIKRTGKKRGKKKLPVPDLDAIKDPSERRRQRRLVKNRNTAAASRQEIPVSYMQACEQLQICSPLVIKFWRFCGFHISSGAC